MAPDASSATWQGIHSTEHADLTWNSSRSEYEMEAQNTDSHDELYNRTICQLLRI